MARPPGPLLLLLLFLLLLLLLTAAVAPGRPCGPAGLSRDTVLGRPGANVTLTCRDEGLANVTVSWQMEERGAGGGPSRRLAEGNALLLRRLRYEDSGRYGCYVGGRLLRSLRLLVEGGSAPGQGFPSRRHPVRRPPSPSSSLLCRAPRNSSGLLLPAEPRQRRPVRVAAAGEAVPGDAGDALGEAEVSWGCRPTPGGAQGVFLSLSPRPVPAVCHRPRRFTAENATEQRCRYFSKARKFVCRVKVPPGADTESLVVSTCVNNGAGGSAGEDRIITLSSVLKPDPPINVTVQALEKAPQRLRVNWSYPSSWDPRFYWLRFQVRYRPEPAQTFTEVDQVMTPWLDIRDALRGTRHVVQVRAQEEFGHGAWSEWSQEVVGTPWTDPWDLTSEMGPFSSQFPMDDDGTYGVTLPPELFWEDAADGAGGAVVKASARSVASPYAFLVAGGSLLLGIALFVAIMVRYRQTWRTGGQRGAKPEGEGQHVLVPLGPPSPPLSDTPLLSPPSPPDPGGLHVTNLDYFFSGQ
ncbi:interleukin-6 receptor subunit alpha isoform X2 [Strix aluco]|uniref:interleukin-6 receptor subunit alpha isoform X2 n=1 Tax=Strix aluco TaxID=111821 RepID=UPI003DA446F4